MHSCVRTCNLVSCLCARAGAGVYTSVRAYVRTCRRAGVQASVRPSVCLSVCPSVRPSMLGTTSPSVPPFPDATRTPPRAIVHLPALSRRQEHAGMLQPQPAATTILVICLTMPHNHAGETFCADASARSGPRRLARAMVNSCLEPWVDSSKPQVEN